MVTRKNSAWDLEGGLLQIIKYWNKSAFLNLPDELDYNSHDSWLDRTKYV